MALRQVLPAFTPASDLGVGDVRPFKRMRNPVPAGFRAGAPLDELMANIEASSSIIVDGAVAAGKSTRVPSLIAGRFGVLVVHVVPSAALHLSLGDYLKSVRSDVRVIDDAHAEWPAKGAILVTAAMLWSRMLQTGKLALPECWLYHDECHESDAYTYLLKSAWGSIEGVQKYIMTTATAGTSGYRKMEGAGNVEINKISMPPSDQWDVYGSTGKPWELASIRGHVLIYEDDGRKATSLVEAYNKAGFDTYRLHSRMAVGAFRTAINNMKNPRGGVVVLIADSSFRSGHTLELSHIIDTCVVVDTVVEGDVAMRVPRPAYAFERYQGAHRGGRVPGESVQVWQADTPAPAKLTVLESVEAEAVALISRLFSRLPPVVVSDAAMAEGPVPSNLSSALTGGMPLALLRGAQLTPLTSGGYVRPPSPMLREGVDVVTPGLDFRVRGVSADVARKYEPAVPPPVPSVSDISSEDSYGRSTVSSTRESVSSAATSVSQGLAQAKNLGVYAQEVGNSEPEVIVGGYYYSDTVPPKPIASAAFPEGHASVMRMFGDLRTSYVTRGLDDGSRLVALAALMQRFNILSAELNATARVAEDLVTMGLTRTSPRLSKWLAGHLERSALLQSESAAIGDVMMILADGYHYLAVLPPDSMAGVEKQHADRLLSQLTDIPRASVQASEVVEQQVKMVQEIPAPEPVKKKLTAPSVAAPDLQYTGMAVEGRGMRARRTTPLTPFMKYVVGNGRNRASSKLVEKLEHPKPRKPGALETTFLSADTVRSMQTG